METHPTILVPVSTLEPVTQPSRCESRQKHCVCLCVHVHPLTLSPLSPPCQCIFHISFQNNLPPSTNLSCPCMAQVLQGPPCCLQKEAQIFSRRLKVFTPMIWPPHSLLNTPVSSLYFSQTLPPALQCPISETFLMLFPLAGEPSPSFLYVQVLLLFKAQLKFNFLPDVFLRTLSARIKYLSFL